VSFANPVKENEFRVDIEVPEKNQSCVIFGCCMELHGGMGNFNPSLSKLLEDPVQTKAMVSSFVTQILDSKVDKEKKIDIIDLFMDLIEELDPKLQIVISDSIDLVQHFKVNFLSQNDKDLLLKQQRLLNKIKSSPNFLERAVAALSEILSKIEELVIAPRGLTAIFNILDNCLTGDSDESLRKLLCELFVKTVGKIKDLTVDDIFLLRELEQPGNPFELLSYQELSNPETSTDTVSEGGLKNS
jgi:hypothetical protein